MKIKRLLWGLAGFLAVFSGISLLVLGFFNYNLINLLSVFGVWTTRIVYFLMASGTIFSGLKCWRIL